MSRTIEGILDQMRNSLKEVNSELASFPQYGNLYAIFRSVAANIIEQDIKLNTISSNLFINNASGEYLDLKAQEFNISRSLGTYSSGEIVVIGNNINVPKGTVLTDNISGFQFTINNPINIISGKAKGTITCTEYSELSNLPSGTELYSSIFSNLRFIVGSFYNPINNAYIGNLNGGRSKESDEELKNRIFNSIQSFSLSNAESFKLAATKINGISKIAIIENQPSIGYITIYINNTESKFLKLVKSELDAIKPIGTSLEIKPFNILPVNISLSVETYSNTIKNQLKNLISLDIQTYINNLSGESILTRESLAAVVMKIPEVINVIINNPTSQISYKQNELLNLNNLTINFI